MRLGWLLLFVVGCAPVTSEQGEKGARGEPGLHGADGERGEAGPPGPPGPAGATQDIAPYMVGESVAVDAGEAGFAQAECDDPSDVLLTGGCAADVALIESRPAVGSYNGGARPQWLCSTGPSDEPQMLSSHAVCLPSGL